MVVGIADEYVERDTSKQLVQCAFRFKEPMPDFCSERDVGAVSASYPVGLVLSKQR